MSIRYIRAKHDKKTPYEKISKKLIRDERLSVSAIGLMIQILSDRDDFTLRVKYIKRRSGLTDWHFRKAWESLKKYKYIIQVRTNGKWNYEIYEEGDHSIYYRQTSRYIIDRPFDNSGVYKDNYL